MEGKRPNLRKDELHSQIQHRLIEELSASESRFRELVEHLHEIVLYCGSDGCLVYVNPAWEALLGYTEEETLGRALVDFLVADDRPRWERLVGSDGGAVEEELCFPARSGVPRWFRVSVRPKASGGFSGLLVDVTARKNLESQLRQAQKMEALGRLAGGVAHDFNNLLTVILGYGEVLQGALSLKADERQCVTEVMMAAERASTLTRQLLAFSRRRAVKSQCFDLNLVVNDMTRMLGRLIPENIELQIEAAPEPALIEADRGQFEQVVVNLAVNARDAMGEGGSLCLRLRTATWACAAEHGLGSSVPARTDGGQCIILEVRDTGSGMDKETVKQAFEPFFTTKEGGKGTGLGLAMVYSIARQSGGAVEIESEMGVGTTVRVIVPESGPSLPAAPPPQREATAPAGRETLLVVEDLSGMRSMLRHTLERRGYVVLTAENGVEALEVVGRHGDQIDLVLSDVVMPEMGGWELRDRLRAELPDVPVVFMSGYLDVASEELAVRLAGAPILEKPFRGKQLHDVLRTHLDWAR